MTSTEELIEQAKHGLRAEFQERIEVLKNELGVLVIEETSKVPDIDGLRADLGSRIDSLRVETRALAESTKQQAVTEALAGIAAAPPKDNPTVSRKLARLHAYADNLADRVGAPRLEAD